MIHQYQLGGYNIVLDSASGGVHAVDEVAYDVIALFEAHSKEEILLSLEKKYAGREDISPRDIEECYEQVLSLKEAGKLFAPDTFEGMAGHLKILAAFVLVTATNWFSSIFPVACKNTHTQWSLQGF